MRNLIVISVIAAAVWGAPLRSRSCFLVSMKHFESELRASVEASIHDLMNKLESVDASVESAAESINTAMTEIDTASEIYRRELITRGTPNIMDQNIHNFNIYIESAKSFIHELNHLPGFLIPKDPKSFPWDAVSRHFNFLANLLVVRRRDLLFLLESDFLKSSTDYLDISESLRSISVGFEEEFFRLVELVWLKVALWQDKDIFIEKLLVSEQLLKLAEQLEQAKSKAIENIELVKNLEENERNEQTEIEITCQIFPPSQNLLNARRKTANQIIFTASRTLDSFRPVSDVLESLIPGLHAHVHMHSDALLEDMDDEDLSPLEEGPTNFLLLVQVFTDHSNRCNSKCVQRYLKWNKRTDTATDTLSQSKFLPTKSKIAKLVLEKLRKIAQIPLTVIRYDQPSAVIIG